MSKNNKSYPFAVVDRCEGSYIQEEKTLEEIARESGVSLAQVQRWAQKYEWKKKKGEYKERLLKAQEETRGLIREEILLQDLVSQKGLLDNYFKGREVLDKGDIPMMQARVNLAEMICRILADMRKRDEVVRGTQKIDRPQMFLDFMRDLVIFFKDRDPASLEAVEKNFDAFIGFAKEKYAA